MSIDASTCPANYGLAQTTANIIATNPTSASVTDYAVTQTHAQNIDSKLVSIYFAEHGVLWASSKSEDNMPAFNWPAITGEPQATTETKHAHLTVTFSAGDTVPKTEQRKSSPPSRSDGSPSQWSAADRIQYWLKVFSCFLDCVIWLMLGTLYNHEFIRPYVLERRDQIVTQTRIWQRHHLSFHLIPATGPGISNYALNSLQLVLWNFLHVFIVHGYF